MRSPEDYRQPLVEYLERLQASGLRQLPRPGTVSADLDRPQLASESDMHDRQPASPSAAERSDQTPATNDSGFAGEQASALSTAATLEALSQEVASCTRCADLVANRSQTVFGVGNPQRGCVSWAKVRERTRIGRAFRSSAGQANYWTKFSIRECGFVAMTFTFSMS